MNFNLKGGESASFHLQAVALKRGIAKWEEVEIVITDPFGFITNHITYKQVDTPSYLVYQLFQKCKSLNYKNGHEDFEKRCLHPYMMKRK